jgi:4-amino-4-deoxychorismate lyase
MPGVGQAEGVSDERVVALWRDGGAVVVPADEPVLSAFDLGLVRGDGVFETVAVTGGGTPHLDAHLARLERSARLMELADPGRGAWQALVDALLARWSTPVEGAMRLLLTRGLGVGLPTTALGVLSPVPAETVRQRTEGIAVVTLGLGVPADFRSTAPWLLGGAKTLSYAVNMAALRHAAVHGADDVIFTSLEGQILEGPTSTVVWSADGVLHTPPPETGILPGTTMARLFARAAEAGRPTAVTPGTVDDLQAADAVWLVSGVRAAATVHTLDGVPRGDAGLSAGVRGLLAR